MSQTNESLLMQKHNNQPYGLQEKYWHMVWENNIEVSGLCTTQLGHGKSEIKDILVIITIIKCNNNS